MNYALCITEDGCKNGWWVYMWYVGNEAKLYAKWFFDGGLLPPQADPTFCLCIKRDACQNGGGLHLWKFDANPDVYGHWEAVQEKVDSVAIASLKLVVYQIVLRPMADASYVLCVTRSGLIDGGWVHMWEQVDQVDMYGQWQWSARYGALRAGANSKFALCVTQDAIRTAVGCICGTSKAAQTFIAGGRLMVASSDQPRIPRIACVRRVMVTQTAEGSTFGRLMVILMCMDSGPLRLSRRRPLLPSLPP